jgi:outer membrane protein
MKPKYLRWFTLALALGAMGASLVRAQQNASPPSPQSGSPNAGPQRSQEPALGTNLDFRQQGAFPNILAPYGAPSVPSPSLGNSPRLHTLLRNGKLELSLDDVISLALENNLDIDVARYQLPIAQADYLRTKGGGAARGITGAALSNALFGGSIGSSGGGGGGGSTGGAGGLQGGGGATNTGSNGCCDPFAFFGFGWDHRNSPLGTLVVSGVPEVVTQNSSVFAGFGQGFFTGTSYSITGFGFRQSSTAHTNLFNPEVPVNLTLGINQHLLQGFGYRANAANFRIAKNDLRVADSTFRGTVITTLATALNLYYTLLSDKEQVRVAEQAVIYAEKLLADNKRQVEIGTLAPIEVVRAESEVATDQGNLVVAQTTYREDQEKLKTALSKRVDPDLAAVEVDVTDKLPEPRPDDIPSLDEALKLASKNRPEIEQAQLNLRNYEITVQSVRSRLLPTLDLFATYSPTGLAGNQVACLGPAGTNGEPTTVPCLVPGGISQAFTQVLHGKYPDYSFGLNFSIPIRNRTAQADAATARLQEYQQRTALQRQVNLVEQDVRNAEIAVTQAKAQIEAAVKARILEQQTLDAERKKFQLGESTVFNVIQTQRDLTTAEGNEVKARATYAQALVTYGQATATILDKYHIEIADAKRGQVRGVPNIPGAPESPTPGEALATPRP